MRADSRSSGLSWALRGAGTRLRRWADRVDERAVEAGGRPGPEAPSPAPTAPATIDPSLYAPATDHAADVLDGAFGHGYLLQVGSDPDLPGFLRHWPLRRVGRLRVTSAPRTRLTVAEGHEPVDPTAILLLGHPVDVDAALTDTDAIAVELLATLQARGSAAVIERAAYLAGRFLLVALTERELTVVPDCLASHPGFYAGGSDDLTLASSEVLVALQRRLDPEPRTASLLARARQHGAGGVLYPPGLLTSVQHVRPLSPNCLLRARPGRPVHHERFWPTTERRQDTDLDRVLAAFSDRLRASLDLLASTSPLTWSLTGGLDSRLTLAQLPPRHLAEATAFTYLNPRDLARSPEVADDLFIPSALSRRLGIPHQVLRWRQAPHGSGFDALHRATYPLLRPSHGAAHAMWADLPATTVQVQSNGAEIGTSYARERTGEPLSPAKAAAQWMGDWARGDGEVLASMQDYLEHTQLSTDRLLGYDHHDVLYWEHRMGRWGYRKFLDGDLGHRVVAPFCDRTLLEIMHRLPEPDRVGRALHHRILDTASTGSHQGR